MQQRVIWFILFLIALSMAFYFFVIDDKRINRMGELESSDVSLSGDVNSTLEVHSRLEKKWIGTSKHVQTLQEETAAHYKTYAAKMDSISDQFLIMDNKINIIDLHSVFRSDYLLNNRKFDFPFDYHWNSYGHSIVADQIEKNKILFH